MENITKRFEQMSTSKKAKESESELDLCPGKTLIKWMGFLCQVSCNRVFCIYSHCQHCLGVCPHGDDELICLLYQLLIFAEISWPTFACV